MMDGSFVKAIVELAAPTLREVDGLQFCDRKLYRVVDDPRPDPLEVCTLTAVADFIADGPDTLMRNDLLLHVEGPGAVSVLGPVEGPTKKRTVHLKSRVVGQAFEFGQYMDTETFIVALQARFTDGGDRSKILQLVGNVKQEQVSNHSDDGISQSVSTRRTVSGALVESSPVPNPVMLSPYRTFRELNQPESAFIFRMRGGGEGKAPQCALFEADGGKWKLDAVQAIKLWLADFCPGIASIA